MEWMFRDYFKKSLERYSLIVEDLTLDRAEVNKFYLHKIKEEIIFDKKIFSREEDYRTLENLRKKLDFLLDCEKD